MTRNYIPHIDKDYILTRPEFAKLVGLSTNALRMRMRRGQYSEYYVRKNNYYLFKRPGAIKVNRPLVDDHVPSRLSHTARSPAPGARKNVNRGNHWEAVKNGSYKSKAQELHNTMKIRAKCDGLLDDETLELLPEAMEKAKQEKRDRVRRAAEESLKPKKSYSTGLLNYSNKGYLDPQYHNGLADKLQPDKFKASRYTKPKEKKYYW